MSQDFGLFSGLAQIFSKNSVTIFGGGGGNELYMVHWAPKVSIDPVYHVETLTPFSLAGGGGGG